MMSASTSLIGVSRGMVIDLSSHTRHELLLFDEREEVGLYHAGDEEHDNTGGKHIAKRSKIKPASFRSTKPASFDPTGV